MRILHVIASLDPAMGGPPMVASRLAAAQAGLGHELTIACYSARGSEQAIAQATAGIPGFDRVHVKTTRLPHGFEHLTGSRIGAFLQPLVAGADVVHLHGIWESILTTAAKLARKACVPYVVAPHGMLDPWSLAQRRLKKRIALALIHGRMLRGAAFLHMLNRDEARLIEPLQLGTPTRVIPNGVFLDEIDPPPPRGRFHAAHPELGGKPYILFLGRLHYKKGLDFLADAFACLAQGNADIRLIVAGPDDGARADFESRVRASGLADRVHLVGPLYGRTKFEALVDAACFCLPSRQEGFSIAITEALACSLPVVISDACHFPEVAEVRAGEVVPLDTRAIAAAIGRIVVNNPLAQQMGRCGRGLVESRFTWPRIAQLTVSAYPSIRPSG